MKRRDFLLLPAGALLASRLNGAGVDGAEIPRDLTLWYKQPAAEWNEALPIGNGRLAAMVFGGVPNERLQLNEDTIWAGEKRDRSNPEGAKNLAEVRRLLFAGKPKEAEALAEKTIIAVPKRMPPYQPLGDLALSFKGHQDPVDYRRELDLESAVARVKYRVDRRQYTREIFASAVDHVIVMRLTCDTPASLSFEATLRRESDATTTAAGSDRLVIRGQAIVRGDRHPDERKVGVRFCGMLDIVSDSGHVRVDADKVSVDNADAATLLFTASTNFREQDPETTCGKYLAAAASRPYLVLRSRHITDHQRLFRRVHFNLGAAKPEVPTNERLKLVQAGKTDLGLEALYFQFGRYLLIASSRPGSMAANLQGKWNQQLQPSWDSKYTININTEMNYWPAEVCNLAELHEPLFDLIENARDDGRRLARNLYGAKGFVIHHNTDLWGDAVPIDGVHAGLWAMGGAWLSLHLWDHYDYMRDKAFLARRAYPVMKEAAEFLLTYLVDDGKGHLVTGPSLSPENQYRMPDGTVAKLCMGPTMDHEITHALFTRVIAAGELLGVDAEFRRQLASARDRLPPLKIGKHGQLQEWMEDLDEQDPGHRHISHLFALYPDDRITIRGTPEAARAARVSLERRLAAGSGHTGWSRAWIIHFWTKLGEGDLAHENIQALIAKSTLPSLLDNHPPFQIDGNFGGTAAMAEMLVQSHSGEIAFLPALPSAWPNGRISGLRARGAIEIDIAWANGKATQARLRPGSSLELKLRAPRGQSIAFIRSVGRRQAVATSAEGVVKLATAAGRQYTVLFS